MTPVDLGNVRSRLLLFKRRLEEKGAGGRYQWEAECQCDGTYCGGHDEHCGALVTVAVNRWRNTTACAECVRLHISAERSWRAREFEPTPEIISMLKRISAVGAGRHRHRNGVPTLEEYGRRIGWPRSALRRVADAEGLTRPKPSSFNRPWDEKELLLLEHNAHLKPASIQQKLAHAGFTRSPSAIWHKRLEQHLKEGSPYYSASQLAEFLGLSERRIGRWVREKKLKPRGREPRSAKQRGEVTLYFHRSEVRRFVRRYPMEIDLRRVNQLWFLDLVFDGRIGEGVERVLQRTAKASGFQIRPAAVLRPLKL